MKCIKCKGEMKETTTTLNSRWGNYSLAISGIKGFKCDSCDELVFSVEETRMIQNITAGLADSKSTEKPDLLNVQEVADLLRYCSKGYDSFDDMVDAIKSHRRMGRVLLVEGSVWDENKGWHSLF